MRVISLWFLSANVPSTGRTRAVGPTGTSVCLWKTPWYWWTTPSANSAYSRSDLSAAIHSSQFQLGKIAVTLFLGPQIHFLVFCSVLSLAAADALIGRGCVLGGRRIWKEASEACHPVPLHQLARFWGAFHPYWHAQVPEKSEELQPPVCWSHRGTLQVSGEPVSDLCCCVWTFLTPAWLLPQCWRGEDGHLHRD